MSFRIDPLGPGTPARLLRVKPIPSRREEDREQRRERREQEEPGASYVPAPEPLADAYGPRASGDTTPTWVAALLRAR
jgi:hypothetical protein